MRGLVAALVLCSASARAEPWTDNVSDADRASADEIFQRGNTELEQGLFTKALATYQSALALWNHPRIHYNIAVALINLERRIEADEEIDKALLYGPAPLEADVYKQALEYQRLLHGQIAKLAIACPEAGTRVTFDNNPLEVPCPGEKGLRILPGRHHLVADMPGRVARSIELAPAGGEVLHERLALLTGEQLTRHHRRWAETWKPWVAIGAGAALALIGGGFELQAAATYRSYDKAVAQLCPGTMPCQLPALITDAAADGRRDNHIAIGFFVAGGATVATGAVLLWLNRSIAERIGYDRLPTLEVGRDHIAARVRF